MLFVVDAAKELHVLATKPVFGPVDQPPVVAKRGHVALDVLGIGFQSLCIGESAGLSKPPSSRGMMF